MKKYLVLLAVVLPTIANAQTAAVIQKPTAKVYASPSATSEVLVTLKKGSKVDVAGVNEAGWAKLKVTVSGFQFEGWVLKNVLGRSPSVAPKAVLAAPSVPAAPVQRPAAQAPARTTSPNQIDQLFEQKSSSPPPAMSQPQSVSNAQVDEFKEPKKSKPEREGANKWTADKLIVYGSPGYMVHQYTFSDATKDAFRYNLSGLSLIVGAEYKAADFFDDLIRVGAILQVQYAFLGTQTNLLDGSNNKFADTTASNRYMDIWFKGKLMVNFQRIVHKPFLVGLTFGYDYSKFSGDDIVADDGTPVGLFIGQTTKSLPFGILTELHFLDPVTLSIGADILVKNSASESPENASGTQPKPGTGFAPYIYLNFPIVGPHYMGIRYNYKIQKTTFTGPSTSRVNNTLNEAEGMATYHTIGLEYDYHF